MNGSKSVANLFGALPTVLAEPPSRSATSRCVLPGAATPAYAAPAPVLGPLAFRYAYPVSGGFHVRLGTVDQVMFNLA
jgi:hypothetical protein